jgi:hypothetical protein
VSSFVVPLITPAVAQSQDLQQQILAKYGNANGDLDDAGLRRLLRDIRATHKNPTTHTNPVIAKANPKPPAPQPKPDSGLPTLSALLANPQCLPSQKTVFVRGDPLDDFHYAIDPDAAADAKGASISYTDNRATATQNATINGRISYLLVGLQCQQADGANPNSPYVGSVGIAPFISSNGTWMEPPGKTVSNSALKTGIDFQTSLYTFQPGSCPL